jgi:hypothetical protein
MASEQLWSDERLAGRVNRHIPANLFAYTFALSAASEVRDEYEAKLAELEAELAAADKRCAELEPGNGWTGLPVDESLGEWLPWEVA